MALYRVVAAITGIAARNENSVEVFRSSLDSIPEIIVAPDLLVPGMRARVWPRPIISACVRVILLRSEVFWLCEAWGCCSDRLFFCSTSMNIKPPIMNIMATVFAENREGIWFLNIYPNISIGIDDTKILSSRLLFLGLSLSLYIMQAAAIADTCMIISNAFSEFVWGRLRSFEATIIWPVEDMGRNSVMPSMRLIMSVESMSIC